MKTFLSRKHLLTALLAGTAILPDAGAAQILAAAETGTVETVTVTARLRSEDAQAIPVSLSVVDDKTLTDTATYNVSRLTELTPSLNYTSPNPRNTAFTIRGLGSSVVAIAQSNDGLEPGVGFYVDGVYHARPATAAFDFTDIERIEVLRGPQGTVFGKNTTAGAINVVTKAPTFDPQYQAEVSGGEYGYAQAKLSVSGPLIDNMLAARLSFTGTRRDGILKNVTTGGDDNNVGDFAIRGELLYAPDEDFRLRFSVDYSAFEATCCTQVYYTVGTTLKPAARQFPAMAQALGYVPASTDPYARITDIDAQVGSETNEGGLAANADWNLGAVTLTSITAWRFWNWSAANDRDYTSLSIQTRQGIPSRQDQYSQELRIASNGTQTLDYVAGLYWLAQKISGNPTTVYGPLATFWLLGPEPAYPSNLLDGYRTDGRSDFAASSYAAFGEATWHITDALRLTGGIRYTYEDKHGSYSAGVSGGLQTTSTTLTNAKLSILRPQSYSAKLSDGSPSGRASVSYDISDAVMAYGTYARGSKSGGINMSGLPLNPSNLPALSTAVIKPEQNETIEFGLKTRLFGDHVTFDIDGFSTVVNDFQANVVDTGPGALRGYLANIEEVDVRGVEFDSNIVVNEHLSGHVSGAFTEGKYGSYKNGPCPLEQIASSTTVCDLTGKALSALPRWALSAGGEYSHPAEVFGLPGQFYLRGDLSYRSMTYGDPSDSRYTAIAGYSLFNLAIGFRQDGPWDVSVWSRNLFDTHYMQNLTVQAGNSGLVLGTPGDPRTVGVRLRAAF